MLLRLGICICDFGCGSDLSHSGGNVIPESNQAGSDRRRRAPRQPTRVRRFQTVAAPLTEIQRSPHIGPVTVWRPGKNLGLDVAKPDRHLTRVSLALGFHDAEQFCTAIARAIGERRKVVELIVWRYLADNPHAFGRTVRNARGKANRPYARLAGPAASSEPKPLLARDSLSGAADNQGIVRLLALTDAINTGVQSLIKPLPAPRHCM